MTRKVVSIGDSGRAVTQMKNYSFKRELWNVDPDVP